MTGLGTEFKVGLFTLAALGVLGYMFLALSPDALDDGEAYEYYTIINDASGVIPKTHVKTNGVTVGKVKDVELTSFRTKITLVVDSDVIIPEGSKVEVRTRGFLGDVYIEIVRTEGDGARIPNKGFIPINENAKDLEGLIAIAGDIAEDVKKVTHTFANVLGTKEGEESVTNIVENIEQMSQDLQELIAENRKGIRETIENLERTTTTIKNVVATREEDLNDIVTNIRLATADLRDFSEGIKNVVDGENRDRIDRIIASFDRSMEDVESTAKSVRLVSEKLEKGEGTLGKLINDEETIEELEGAIKDIREVLSPVKRMEVGVDTHVEIRSDESAQSYFNVHIKTAPDRFYLIGFTDRGEKEVETVTETDQEDGKPLVRETVRSTDAIGINLQFAKRWDFLQLRLGLFESAGGFAADIYLWDDRLRWTMEAFNWDSESRLRKTAHLKTYASILFFNHIYAMVGIDDITRKNIETGEPEDELNFFMGAGLTFTDQDLRAIFGTAALAL